MGVTAFTTPHGSGERLFFWGVAALLLAALVRIHMLASLTLPTPSGDEAFFVWQACAFAKANSFIAPELDATRPILLLPFVHQALVGMVFKFTGCSLEIARHLSLVCVAGAAVALAALVRRHAVPIVSLLVVAAFLLNPRFVVMANQVRMEALLLFLLTVAVALLAYGHRWIAVALLSVSPMIHPNAILYLLPLTVYAVRNKPRPPLSAAALLVFGVSALVWLAHAVYVIHFWDGFVYDTSHRFGEAATGTAKAGLNKLWGIGLIDLALIAGVAIVARRRNVDISLLVLVAAGAWLHSHLRIEEPYAPFGDLVYLMLVLAIIEIAASAVRTTAPATRYLITTAAALVLAAGLLRAGRIEGPLNYAEDLSFAGMKIAPEGAYFQRSDRAALRAAIASVAPDRAIVVEVHPWADGVLTADFEDVRVRYQVPYFDSLFRPQSQWIWGFGPTPAPLPDLYVVRLSRYTPSHLRYRADSILARARSNPRIDAPVVLHVRDSSEVWYGLRVTPD